MSHIVSDKAELILWDVVEEHLDEAAFLVDQWESALHSPKFDLKDLAKIERRLEGHIDGLIVGGNEVSRRILDLELANADERGRAVVSALALLFSRDDKNADRVLKTAL